MCLLLKHLLNFFFWLWSGVLQNFTAPLVTHEKYCPTFWSNCMKSKYLRGGTIQFDMNISLKRFCESNYFDAPYQLRFWHWYKQTVFMSLRKCRNRATDIVWILCHSHIKYYHLIKKDCHFSEVSLWTKNFDRSFPKLLVR